MLLTTQSLESYGIFEKVSIEIDTPTAASSRLSGSNAPVTPADIHVHVKEKVWYGLRTELNQELHTGEVNVKLSAAIRNLFGRAERIEASTLTDGQTDAVNFNTFSLSLTKPRLAGTHAKGYMGIFSTLQNHSSFASCHERAHGLTLSASDKAGRHEVGYEAALREIFPVARKQTDDEAKVSGYKGPSASLLSDAAVPSTKSSVKYTYTLDRLDTRLVPTRGFFVQSIAEVAGLGGDVHFAKAQVEAKYYQPVHPRVSIGCSVMAGLLQPLSPFLSVSKSSPPSARSHLSDRFFFGTPLTMRGFESWSLGPVDHHDTLGGEVTASTALSASVLLPDGLGGSSGARLHAFVNGGNLVGRGASAGRSWADVGTELWTGSRVSAGVGVVVPTPFGRLEFNLVRALRKAQTDRTKQLQVGLGLQFL